MSNDLTRGWSRETGDVLRRAGWKPGRAVPTGTWGSVLGERGAFVLHGAAEAFLAEFGGLVTYGWPADSITTASAVRFDPLGAAWQRERFAEACREAGTSLCPVGTADQGASLLGISEDGVIHLVRESAEPIGTSIDQALDRLVETQRAQSGLWSPGGAAQEHPFWRRFRAGHAGPDTESRRPEETGRVLRTAGWSPGREVATDTWESILLHTGEFAALGVPHRDPADSMPWMEFSLDPLAAMWDAEIIDDLAEQAGTELYPIGTRDRGSQYLAMAEDGAVYAGMDHVHLLAPTPDEALRRLTTRIRPEATP
ncbi:SUKH-3 domain-containing protein [Streptomyces althioticus]|uniref:SUKH-3 domain-containing protein n=1 Tax=Streptomyces althioticus TaxID=83380 RepID=UPI003793EE1B